MNMSPPYPRSDVEETLATLRARLMAGFDSAGGHWTGRLSSSAVATAIAAFALARVAPDRHGNLVRRGLDWIAGHINQDGGWGDSPESPSNISATVLCWSALSATEATMPAHREAAVKAEAWLARTCGGLSPRNIQKAISARYGNDRTFAAPIMTVCALAGRLGPEKQAWQLVPQLPFELAVFPHRLYKWLGLTVVSYALPALIAIGLVRHRHSPCVCPVKRGLRDMLTPGMLKTVERMQPVNGGFEEATPLTGFVTVSLGAAGYADTEIVRRGVKFLVESARPDGSWPIDTNLSTWLTCLSIDALWETTQGRASLSRPQLALVAEWLLSQQYRAEHPLTFGAPGGWAWTDLPGGMPDADDTSAALVALRRVAAIDDRTRTAASEAIRWLLDLQNRDGGIPTFSRGWGKLPFDRSCPDITAHTLRAFSDWLPDVAFELRTLMIRSSDAALRYLHAAQRADGSWVPLWFGNQWSENEFSPTYGTARVVTALQAASAAGLAGGDQLASTGASWLVRAQNADGGWGGDRGVASSIEETSLAVTALAETADCADSAIRGAQWLVQHTDHGKTTPACPIGLYFARLWYSEDLYPLVFATGAIGRLLRRTETNAAGTDAILEVRTLCR